MDGDDDDTLRYVRPAYRQVRNSASTRASPAAKCTGVSSSTFWMLGFALLRRSAATAYACRSRTATCNGVSPDESRRLTRAPLPTRNWIVPTFYK